MITFVATSAAKSASDAKMRQRAIGRSPLSFEDGTNLKTPLLPRIDHSQRGAPKARLFFVRTDFELLACRSRWRLRRLLLTLELLARLLGPFLQLVLQLL